MLLFDRLYNFHWASPGVGRSAQPYLGFYRPFLVDHGIKSIINLRGANPKCSWWKREKDVSRALGIGHFDVRLSTRNLPDTDRIATLFGAFASAQEPILFKCSGGQDRTSLAVALYQLHRSGAGVLPLAQLQFSAWPYLHRPRRDQAWMRDFPAFAVESARDLPLAKWAPTYSQEQFVRWLATRGMNGSYEGLQR